MANEKEKVQDLSALNGIYREISDELGLDTAMELYRMFKGQQVSFPMRLFDGARIREAVLREYDGSNLKQLAMRYGYSEKTIRRIIKDGGDQR